jgi:hypothetical protein
MSAHAATAHGHATTHEHHDLGFLRTYVFSTDHKMIAKQFLLLGLFMMLLGGALALVVRWQLAWPETPVPGLGGILKETGGVLEPSQYNMAFTMHATIMVFFVVMPILAGGFGNFLIPLMIGARDMAFPTLNMLSFWTTFSAGIVMLIGFFVPGGHGLDVVRAAVVGGRVHRRELGPEHLVHQPLRHGRWLHDGLHQLHHDRHQHARARHEPVPDAAGGLVAVHHGDPAPARAARPHVGRGDAAVRPLARHELVPAVGRR